MQNLQDETADRQDTLATPAYVMIESLRRAIEATGLDVPTERVLTLTLYVATAQAAKVLHAGSQNLSR